jgi:triacylglycerol lipase
VITPKLRAPIILVHGLLGFDRVKVGGYTLACYFPGIADFLTAAGNRVLEPRLSPTHGVADRAAQLKAFLDRHLPGECVHLIAHSMGGLDSRYLIARLGMADRVLTLTTIGTPHRGTAFADWGVHRLGCVLRPVLGLLNIPFQAFYDLTTARCRTFNEEVPDAPGVRYFSVAGRHDGHWLNPEWKLPQWVVTEAEGPNDGVVSLASATYGESCEIWEGDHLSLVNWHSPVGQVIGRRRERTPAYSALVRRLADEGF